MQIAAISLRDLQYVSQVAKLLSFSKAALSLNVSQPALSEQIKKVESHLDVTIFERTNKYVRITTVGEKVITCARRVLEEAEHLWQVSHSSQLPFSSPFRVGAIASLGPYLIPKILPALKKVYPDGQFIFREGLTDQLREQLHHGEIDAFFASPTFDLSGLSSFEVFFEPFYLAAPKKHPLLAKLPIHKTDLRADELVLLEEGHCLKDQTLSLCSAKNRKLTRKEIHATSIETLRHLVASGYGYTLMPQLAVEQDSYLRNLISYEKIAEKEVGRDVILVCNQNSSRTNEVHLLLELVKKLKIIK